MINSLSIHSLIPSIVKRQICLDLLHFMKVISDTPEYGSDLWYKFPVYIFFSLVLYSMVRGNIRIAKCKNFEEKMSEFSI